MCASGPEAVGLARVRLQRPPVPGGAQDGREGIPLTVLHVQEARQLLLQRQASFVIGHLLTRREHKVPQQVDQPLTRGQAPTDAPLGPLRVGEFYRVMRDIPSHSLARSSESDL